ncbi:MAG: hypothetical protein PHF86_00550 [Candidatus Nanoarchaeia archaeon]|nr:hypothetical protein [Candidatus Nanoarchaeia archaeon]
MNHTMEISKKCRDKIIEALQKNLDTRDKRFMFLKICFKELVSKVQLEGSSHETAWNLYSEFEKQCMVGSLAACLNSYFDEDLYLF